MEAVDLVIAYVNNQDAVFGSNLGLNYFWRINKRTKDKEDYLKREGLL